MATIPFRDNTNVRSRGIGGSVRRANSQDLFGDGTNRQVLQQQSQTLSEVGDSLLKKQRRDDLDAVLTADTLYKRVEAEKIRSLTSSKGNKARGLTDKATAWYEGNTSTIDGEPTVQEVEYQNFYETLSEEQRNAWDKKRGQRLIGLKETIANHEEKESLAALKDVFIANNEASLNSAMVEFNDPGAVIQARVDIQKNIQAYGATVGWTSERIAAETRNQMAIFHSGIINSFLAGGDTAGAEAYFKASKGKANDLRKIPGEVLPELQAKIKSSVNLRKAQEETDRIMRTVEGEANQLAAARKITDPKVRDDVVSRIVTRNTQIRALQKQESFDTQDRVYKLIESGEAKTASDIPIEEWDLLSSAQKTAMRASMENLAKPPVVHTEPAIRDELNRMWSDPATREQFMATHIPSTYSGRMSKTDIDHFSDIQAKFRSAEPKEIQSLLTREEIISSVFDSLGWTGEDHARRRGDFSSRINYIVADEELSTGKKLTVQRYQELVRQNMTGGMFKALETRYPVDPEIGTDTFTLTQQLGTAFETAELTGKENVQLRGQVKTRVQKIITDRETKKGRRLRDEERIGIIDTVLQDKVMIDRPFFPDKEVLAVELAPDELKDAYVEVEQEGKEAVKVLLTDLEALPDEQARDILNTLQKSGLPITLQNIANVWVPSFREGREKGKMKISELKQGTN